MMQSLQNKLCQDYGDMILQKKVKFGFIEDKIPFLVREKLLAYLIEQERKKFRENIFEDLRNELLIATCKDYDIQHDMRNIWNGDDYSRELVQDINIQFKEARYMWAILDPINEEDVEIIAIGDTESIVREQYKNENEEYILQQILVDSIGINHEQIQTGWESLLDFANKKYHGYDYESESSGDYGEEWIDF